MRITIRFGAAAALVAAAASAAAQPLSTEDCIRTALARSDQLTAADLAVQAAAHRVAAARTFRRPNASLVGRAAWAPQEGYDPALTDGGELAARLEVSERLWDRAAGAGVRASDVDLESQIVAHRRVESELRRDVRVAFIALRSTRERARLAMASRDDLEGSLGKLRALAQGGAAPKSDVLKLEIEARRESALLTERRAEVAQAERRLAELLGVEPGEPIAIEDSTRLPPVPVTFEPDSTFEMRSLVATVRAADAEVTVRRAARAPVVSLFGSAGAWTSLVQLEETDSPQVLGFMAGAEVAWPIWDGGTTSARVAEQSALVAALHAESRALARRIRTAEDSVATQYSAAIERRALLEATRVQAAEQYDGVVARYAGGGSSGLEVLDAHRSWLEVALEAEEARAAVEELHAQLLFFRGEPK